VTKPEVVGTKDISETHSLGFKVDKCAKMVMDANQESVVFTRPVNLDVLFDTLIATSRHAHKCLHFPVLGPHKVLQVHVYGQNKVVKACQGP